MGNWIVGVVERMGYFGIALLTFLENVFPPIPSEVILPLAGYVSSRGDLTLGGAVVAGAIGSLAGCTCWYLLARWVGEHYLRALVDKHGRWFTLHNEDLDRAQDWFRRHGGATVFFGRLAPAVRTLISVPAGLSRMPALPFLVYSSLGTAAWTALLTGAGYWLGESFGEIEKPLGWTSTMISIALLGYYLYRVVTFEKSA